MWSPTSDALASASVHLSPGVHPGEIITLSNLPAGEVDPELVPAAWHDRFAVVADAPGQMLHLLATPPAMGSHALFELRRRLRQLGGHDITVHRASPEILKLLYRRDDLVPGNQMAAHDATQVERFAHDLIEQAIRQKASDIHIETREDHALVLLRINGMRHVFSTISTESARALGVVLYSVHADATSKDVSWDAQQVMDGVIEHRTLDGRHAQLRFSSAPIFPSGNFHIVIRVLMMDTSDRQLSDLGYSTEQLVTLENISAGLSGMVMLCGPTNSGKSTTLQALMKTIHRRLGDTVKMITVEDPVEYLIPGACQIGVARKRRTAIDERTGSAFTTFLRGTLRQDPDVVMVGEIRDLDSAAVVKDLVLAGRKVLTTLHTYSAIWAFVRLRELGVPIELLTMPGFVSGVVYQRLVPTLCQHCSMPLASAAGRARLDVGTLQRLERVVDPALHPARVRGDGCAHCRQSGISGRTLCAEFVVPDKALLDLIARERYLEAERHWQQRGHLMVDDIGVSALAHGLSKLRQGLLDPRDLENNIGLLDGLETES